MGQETIGWWCYDHNTKTLKHQQTSQIIRYIGRQRNEGNLKLTLSANRHWMRFCYEDTEIRYPLLVEWRNVSGRLVWRVDYIRSTLLGQNSDIINPPTYGVWKRVDECIIDGLACWPCDFETKLQPNYIALNGGWLNSEWTKDLYRAIPHWSSKGTWNFNTGMRSEIPPLDIVSTQWVYVPNSKFQKQPSTINLLASKGSPAQLEKNLKKLCSSTDQLISKDGDQMFLALGQDTPLDQSLGDLTSNKIRYLYVDKDFVTDSLEGYYARNLEGTSEWNFRIVPSEESVILSRKTAEPIRSIQTTADFYRGDFVMQYQNPQSWIALRLTNAILAIRLSFQDHDLYFCKLNKSISVKPHSDKPKYLKIIGYPIAGLSSTNLEAATSLNQVKKGNQHPLSYMFEEENDGVLRTSSYTRTMGYWIYDPENQCLFNDWTKQRIKYVERIDNHLDDKVSAWAHPLKWLFYYEDHEVRYPLIISSTISEANNCYGYTWHVDHISSAKVWRKENNINIGNPPYGLWRRVDDCLSDAFLAWPVLDETGPKPSSLNIQGGWYNGRWFDSFRRRIGTRGHFSEFDTMTRPSPITRLDISPVSWEFFDTPDYANTADLANIKEVTSGFYTLSSGADLSGFQSSMPYLKRSDGKAFIFPAGRGKKPSITSCWNCFILYADDEVFFFLDGRNRRSTWHFTIHQPKCIGLPKYEQFNPYQPNGLPIDLFTQRPHLQNFGSLFKYKNHIDPSPKLAQKLRSSLIDAWLQWQGANVHLSQSPVRIEKDNGYLARDWEGLRLENSSCKNVIIDGGYLGGRFSSNYSIYAGFEDA